MRHIFLWIRGVRSRAAFDAIVKIYSAQFDPATHFTALRRCWPNFSSVAAGQILLKYAEEPRRAEIWKSMEISFIVDKMADQDVGNKELRDWLGSIAKREKLDARSRPFACYVKKEAAKVPTNSGKPPNEATIKSFMNDVKGEKEPSPKTLNFLRNWRVYVPAVTKFTSGLFVHGGFFHPFRVPQRLEIEAQISSPTIEIVQFTGPGGMGKTTALYYWRERLKQSNWIVHGNKVRSFFEFSFADQGEETIWQDAECGPLAAARRMPQSAGTPHAAFARLREHYDDNLLRWWATVENSSLEEFGTRLAECHANHSGGIVVLDGVETQLEDGKMPSVGLRQFLRHLTEELHNGNNDATGRLLVLATRQPIADLERHEGKRVKTIELERLSDGDGADYLEHFEGETGRGPRQKIRFGPEYASDPQRRRRLLEDIAGHLRGVPLALYLFAHQLIEEGACLDGIPDDLIESRESRGNDSAEWIAQRMVERYDAFFSRNRDYETCRELLLQLSLFSKTSITLAELHTLWSRGCIEGLVSRESYDGVCCDLARMGLINADWKARCEMSVHPVVRKVYRERLQNDCPQAWRDAHDRLYLYYERIVKSQRNQTESGLLAARHAVDAGRHRAAYRVLKGIEAADVAAAPGKYSELAAACLRFFTTPCLFRSTERQDEMLTDAENTQVCLRLAKYRIFTRGMADRIAGTAYDNAETIASSLPHDDPETFSLRFAAAVGSWRHRLVRAELGECLRNASRFECDFDGRNDPYVKAVCRSLCFITRFFAAASNAEGGAAESVRPLPIDERRAKLCEFPLLYDPWLNVELFRAWQVYFDGDADAAEKHLNTAVEMANELDEYANSLLTYYCAAALNQYKRKAAEVKRWTQKITTLTRGKRETFLSFGGHFLAAWADGFETYERTKDNFPKDSIEQMRVALEGWEATGARLVVPYFQTVIAEALMINRDFNDAKCLLKAAMEAQEATQERWYWAQTQQLLEKLPSC